MIYVGNALRPADAWGRADPALLDPRLEVASRRDLSGQYMPYWPSYSQIPPSSRAAYLDWLAGGRSDPAVAIGYVFLFFYGLERRVLVDATALPQARSELPAISAEIDRLLSLYGENRSFLGYAGGLRDYIRFAGGSVDLGMLEPPSQVVGWDIPNRMKVALGKFVAEGQTIPADWALAWYRLHRSSRLRTAARRCPAAFDQLFRLRYRDRFGEGMTVKEPKRRLELTYRPASAGISSSVPYRFDESLPDVADRRAPLNRLADVADQVYEELDSYSRWVGRHDDRDSLVAVALLPRELAREWAGEEADALREWIRDRLGTRESVVVDPVELVEYWPSSDGELKLSRRDARSFADLLEHFGYGIEPDCRYTSRNFSTVDRAVIYRLHGDPSAPGEMYEAATILLHLGAAVATADETVTAEEEHHLEAHLESALRLTGGERRRLRAHLQWLLAAPPTFHGVRKRVEQLEEEVRSRLGTFLLTLAGADGRVTREELEVLAKIYPILGLEADALYGDVHDLAARGPEPRGGPVTVLPRDPAEGHRIPRPPRPEDAVVELDRDRVEQIRSETREVSAVLARVFAGGDLEEEPDETIGQDEGSGETEVPGGSEGDSGPTEGLAGGLDAVHASFVQILAGRQRWSAEAFRELAEDHRLMAAGAMEVVNEAAFEVCGEPLLEGDDPVEVNSYALEQMSI